MPAAAAAHLRGPRPPRRPCRRPRASASTTSGTSRARSSARSTASWVCAGRPRRRAMPSATGCCRPGRSSNPPFGGWRVGDGDRVVFNDDVGMNRHAIRGYWLLRLYGFPRRAPAHPRRWHRGLAARGPPDDDGAPRTGPGRRPASASDPRRARRPPRRDLRRRSSAGAARRRRALRAAAARCATATLKAAVGGIGEPEWMEHLQPPGNQKIRLQRPRSGSPGGPSRCDSASWARRC